jgi:hypothetical protein
MWYKKLILTPLFILSIACSGTMQIKERVESNLSCRSLPASEAPGWVFDSRETVSDYYYGVGVADGFGITFNEMKARSRSFAESEISSSLETRITSDLRQSVTMSASSGSSDLNKTVQQVIKSNSDLLLSDVEVDSSWFNQEACQLWTRVKLSRNSLKQSKKEMKTMVMLKLEESSKSIENIKATIESDPDVILRKYELKINANDYYNALSLDLSDDEFYTVLRLYSKFDITPNRLDVLFDYKPYFMTLMETGGASSIYGRRGFFSVLHFFSIYEEVDMKVFDRTLKFFINENMEDFGFRVYNFFEYRRELSERHANANAWLSERNETESNEYSDDEAQDLYNEMLVEKNLGEHREKYNDTFYAVHSAACYGAIRNLKILGKNGFSMNKKTKKGLSPLEVAEACGNKKTIGYLR